MSASAISSSRARLRRKAWLLVPAVALAVDCNRSSSNNPSTTSTATAAYDATVATTWMQKLYDLIKATNVTPPVASRACAYAGVTLYESVVPGMPAYRSLKDQLNDFDGVPQPTGVVDYRIVR